LAMGCELDTSVTQECLGAAALVFVAGKERVVGAQASIGFERVGSTRMPDAEREELEGNALDIFRESDVKKPFANRALTSAHDQMWFPSIEEMQSAGVVTKTQGSVLMTDASRATSR